MTKSNHNEGIIVQGGSINAGNLAVGRGAKAISIGAPEPVATPAEEQASLSVSRAPGDREWDAFISHASEDKKSFVEPLARALQQRGLRIWYDDFALRVGSSLRESIDFGLAKSRYGIVVLSRNFFAKDWTHRELAGLMAMEEGGAGVILPVWHNVTQEQVRSFSPIMADRVAAKSADGLGKVVETLLRAIAPQD
ncbi:MAG TPA: toll/interleukin-1 receptor domain-containing protein [Terriglobales bacterium]